MDKKHDFTEKYFESHPKPNEEEFLDYACEAMFLGYLVKSLMETRRKYIIQIAKRTEAEITKDIPNENVDNSIYDNYECYFDSLIADLTAKQRLYLKLSYKLGYTDRMVASYMKIKPQSVYDIKNAALARLRKELCL